MPEPVKCLGERFQDAFLRGWGDDRLVAYADLPAEAQAKWNRAALAFVCTLSDAPSELKTALQEARDDAVAFCGPWAATYARDHGLPDGHLFASHYDILERNGARMVAFTRHDPVDSALSPGGADE